MAKRTTKKATKPTTKKVVKPTAKKTIKPKAKKTTKKRIVKPVLLDVPKNKKTPFYIVGIGTSAGGLEALESFFDACPFDSGLAFVIVQHLSPDYKSLMTELLSRHTRMKVTESQHGVEVEPDHIYLIPGKKNLTIKDGKLELTKRPVGAQMNFSIDIFFHSLAAEQKGKSIGIILSGTGSDGTRGGKSIKEVGGTVFVQSPESSRFDGMPRSAINHGLADYVLSPAQMPSELIQFISYPHYDKDVTGVDLGRNLDSIDRILKILKNHTGYDFFSYKKPTLLRRTAKRMNITKSDSVESYIDYVYDNPDEKFILVDEFLIGVTKFFRDQQAYQILEDQVIPDIVEESRSKRQAIKVWVVACSTGEEAYSLAILFEEYLAKKSIKLDYKIFATDIDSKAIDTAAKGIYSENIATDVSQERLSKFFIRKENSFQILPKIRKNIIFSKHDILQHPPFNKMNLVSCRNMMIYLDSSIQGKVLSSLHYALKVSGYLFMGSSENIGPINKSFAEVSNKWKIYRNVHPTKVINLADKGTWQIENHSLRIGAGNRKNNSLQDKIIKATNQVLMEEMDAVSVCVDENFDIIHASGKFKKFITMPEEGFSNNVLQILPDDLNIPITTAVRRLMKVDDDTIIKNVKIVKDDKIKHLRLVIRLLGLGPINYNSFLITIVEKKERVMTVEEKAFPNPVLGVQSEEVKELKEALSETRENLQSTIEELETSNEEMQATNEELLASNEELQSTNEELQSLNEELHTVNAELQEKNVQLLELNSDIENLMVNTNIGTIFLDRDFNIRKFTPAIREHFQLRDDDTGRPIEHFSGSLGGHDLMLHAQKVLKDLVPFKLEFQNNKGIWFLLQIYPYRTQSDTIMGVIVNFININDLKESDQKGNELDKYISYLTQSSPALIYVYNLKTRANVFSTKSVLEIAGYSPEEIKEVGPELIPSVIHPDDLPKIIKHHRKLSLAEHDSTFQIEYRIIHRKTRAFISLLSTDRVHERDEKGNPVTILGVGQDITYVKNMEAQMKESEERANLAIQSTGAGMWEWSDLTQDDAWWSPQFYKLLGYSPKKLKASYAAMLNIIHPDHVEHFQEELEDHIKKKKVFNLELKILTNKKKYRWFRISAQAEWYRSGTAKKIVGILVDIDQSHQLQEGIEEKQLRLEAIYNNAMVGIILMNDKGLIQETSKGLEKILGYTQKEIVGKKFLEMTYKEDLDFSQKEFQRLKKDQIPFMRIDTRFLHKDKTFIWAGLNIRKLSLKGKTYYLAVMTDINQHKNTEEKIYALNEELSRFVYLASHDLKEPLRTISSVTERFKDKYEEKFDEKAMQYIEFIEKASNRMQNLTAELLTYSELGNKIEKYLSVNVNKVVKQVINIDLQEMINENKATIITGKLPNIKGDVTQIKLLFQNLIGNSIKYRKKVAPKIEITCQDKIDDWQFAVKDNGIGIPPEDQDKIFEVFRRLHTKNEYEGSGIGLANCKRIVDNHNGEIWVRSTPRRGSIFYFTIPKKNTKKK